VKVAEKLTNIPGIVEDADVPAVEEWQSERDDRGREDKVDIETSALQRANYMQPYRHVEQTGISIHTGSANCYSSLLFRPSIFLFKLSGFRDIITH